ncbi:hypothetical protein SteCoe_22737 [Stentor coeruleus]|uniref:Uncharacterized protein n=1 Tax=Stentor coeruleus TaxID=5963 RepID=A0A1R2BLB2_9CILI|nr:hypothetical protein SteCoe_22737 [Stentor coeruleus]
MNWIERFLPSCCTSRKPHDTITNPKLETGIINQLDIISIDEAFSQEELTKNEMFSLSSSEEHLENTKVNSEVIIETPKPIEIYPISLGKSNIENNTTSKLLCGFCGSLALGYCPGCPSLRFCKECYNENHIIHKKPHQFISYIERKKSFCLNNGMKKLKVFM